MVLTCEFKGKLFGLNKLTLSRHKMYLVGCRGYYPMEIIEEEHNHHCLCLLSKTSSFGGSNSEILKMQRSCIKTILDCIQQI